MFKERFGEAASVAMMAFKPTDKIEAMIAAQAIAQHNTAMECSRRAMLPEQPHEAAQAHRKASANASRAFTELLTALDRKRGKGGQQKVVVEHVHVHAGGQAIFGHVETGGRGGGAIGVQGKPGASPARLAHDAPTGTGGKPVRRAYPKRQPVPVAGDAEWAVPDARRQIDGPRTAEGLARIKAARTKHGLHTAEMIELRRLLAEERRLTKALLRALE